MSTPAAWLTAGSRPVAQCNARGPRKVRASVVGPAVARLVGAAAGVVALLGVPGVAAGVAARRTGRVVARDRLRLVVATGVPGPVRGVRTR